MTSDCLFCRMVAGTIPVGRLYEDESVIAFADINPQAPVHLLIIPKVHVASLAHTTLQDAASLGHLLAGAAEVARTQQMKDGYRIVINTGADGGQTVEHLHLHLLGGRQMSWPPG